MRKTVTILLNVTVILITGILLYNYMAAAPAVQEDMPNDALRPAA